MKALIWISSFFVITLLNTILGIVLGFRAGFLLIYFFWFWLANKLCCSWDKHVISKNAISQGLTPFQSIEKDVPSEILFTLRNSQYNQKTLKLYIKNWVKKGYISKIYALILLEEFVPVGMCFEPSPRPEKAVFTNEFHFCTACGEKLLENSNFCRKCGESVPQSNFGRSVPDKIVPNQKNRKKTNQPVYNPAHSPARKSKSIENKNIQKSKIKILVLLIILGIALLAIIAAISLIFKNAMAQPQGINNIKVYEVKINDQQIPDITICIATIPYLCYNIA